MNVEKDNPIKSVTAGEIKVEGLSLGIKCPECGSANDVEIISTMGKKLIDCMGHYDDGSGCGETYVSCWEMNTTVTVHRLEPNL